MGPRLQAILGHDRSYEDADRGAYQLRRVADADETLALYELFAPVGKLVEKGFGDPVMDQETLTLTYQSAERLLQDVRALGGNPCIERRASLVSRSWRAKLLAALEEQRKPDGLIHLSIEVAYGHAWRLGHRQQGHGETYVSVSSIKRKSS